MLKAWPALSYHFGLHPWDVGRLSEIEIDFYLEALRDLNEASK